ncbi:all-trans retinoic acid-induced differentiation factor isoform X2 [Epinephelus lanceolatus]|uniref:all-trans retinoic acid-induced differentiation factor isoform X2 n=1 Tax=Epinephelus lanceolatus TaxID=310571 RepID=UPI0014478511|nr:all-trans retinoic acid-induced differentiation factor isoform X2 [Epinephelus lanceolatus]
MKMKAGCSQLKPVVLILIFNSCFYASYQLTGLQVCELCSGAVLNGSAVGMFCSSSAGRIDGRCCLRISNTGDPEHIIGLDLSNCSLTHMEDLQGASTALIMILPQDIFCPGGNTSWEKVEVKDGNRLCEGQRNMCNQTGQLSLTCPENSLCGPYGPGFFECSCVDSYHGYKCLREGEFPALQVFGPLGASTVVISVLLWVTQRRKAKSL